MIKGLKVKHALFLILCSATGCSPSSLFEKAVDQQILKIRQYRQINPACGGLNLGSAELDVQTLRSLVTCLNGKGNLTKTDVLINNLEDSEVEPIVRFVNHYILQNPERLYLFENNYDAWADSGLEKQVFGLLADVLNDPKFLLSLVKILRAGYYIPKSEKIGSDPAKLTRADYVPDQKLLVAVQLLIQQLDESSLKSAIDLGLLMTQSPAFSQLRDHLLASRPAESEKQRDAQNLELIRGMHRYLNEKHTFKCNGKDQEVGSELRHLILNEEFSPLLDQLLGTDGRTLIEKAPQVVQVSKGLVQRFSGEVLLDLVESAFYHLGRDKIGPLKCLKESKSIPDATRYLISELVEFHTPSEAERYLSYDAPLTLMALGPFCDFPKGLQHHYSALFRLVDGGIAEQMVTLLGTLYRQTSRQVGFCQQAGEVSRPWLDWVTHFLADGGADGAGGSHHLTPLISDLIYRDLLPDLLLLALVPNQDERSQVGRILNFLVKPQSELGNLSIAEVFLKTVARSNDKDLKYFNDFMKGLGGLLGARNGKFFEQALTTLRGMNYVNQANPFLDFMQDFGTHLTDAQHIKLFESLFAMVQDSKREKIFIEGVQELAGLAKSGELQSVVESVMQLFQKSTRNYLGQLKASNRSAFKKIQRNTKKTEAPQFKLVARHTVQKLSVEEPVVDFTRVDSHCRGMNLEFSLADVHHDEFNQEMKKFLGCKSSSGKPHDQHFNQTLNSLIDFSDTPVAPGFLKTQVKKITQFNLGFDPSEIAYLVNGWMEQFPFKGHADEAVRATERAQADSNRVVRIMTGAKVWADEVAIASQEGLFQKVLQPFFNPAMKAKAEQHVNALSSFSGQELRHEDFPKNLGDVREILQRTGRLRDESRLRVESAGASSQEDRVLNKIYTPELREVLKVWVQSVECWRPHLNVDQRVDEIIHESKNRVTTYDLVGSPQKPEAAHAHMGWGLDEIKAKAEPILDRFREVSRSQPRRRLLDAPLKFMLGNTAPHPSLSQEVDVGQPAFKGPFQRGSTWVRRSPETLLKLFHQRALRVRPRVQYYKGYSNPYVVLDSDLDLFEKSLYNVNMKLDVHPGKNFALLFTEEIALAWGDLPPKQWPEEIVKKFHLAVDIASRQEGRPYSDWDADTQYQYNLVRPRTLKESVDNIINRPGDPKVDLTENVLSSLGGFAAGLWRSDFRSNLSNFSSMTGFEDFKKLTQKVAGLPSVPSCIKLAKVDPTADEPDAVVMVNLPPELNRPEYRQPSVPRDSAGNFLIQQSLMALKTLQGLNGQVELANMQGQLFNLWQSINVMKENYPGSPFNTYGDEGLLEPMRDLFYEIFYSNPDSVLRQLFPSTLLVENNLAVVSQVIDLGILHQMSVQLQKFELDDPELTDLVLSLVRAGSSVSMPDLLKFLLTQEPHSGELKDQMIWKVLELMYGASPEESAKIKQLLFHLMAALHRVDGWNRSQQASGGYGVADHALRRGLEVLNQSGEQLFTARLPKRGAPVSEPPSELALKQVLTSDWIGHLAEGFYRVMSNQTAGGSEALDRSTRWTRLFKSALADPAPGVTPLPVHAVSLLTLLLEDAQAWDALLQIVDKMSLISNRPAYQGLGLSSYGDEFLDFIEGKSSHTSIRASQKFAQKLRGQVAGLFDSGGDNSSNIMNEFLIFAYHNPESVAQLLNVFSQSVENGQLLEFLKVIRRSLPESSQ